MLSNNPISMSVIPLYAKNKTQIAAVISNDDKNR